MPQPGSAARSLRCAGSAQQHACAVGVVRSLPSVPAPPSIRGSGGGGPRGARPAPAACPAAAEVGDVTGAAKLLCPDDLKGVALDILARLGRAVGPPGHPGASGAPVVGGDVTEGYKSPLVPSGRACGLPGAPRSASPGLPGWEGCCSCSPPPWHLVQPYPKPVHMEEKKHPTFCLCFA